MLTEIVEVIQERWDFFLGLLLEHIQISAVAIVIAMAIGLTVGILISEYRGSSKVVMGIIKFIYTIPSISLLGFLIPLSGVGDTTAIIALTVYALLPMVRNTHTGFSSPIWIAPYLLPIVHRTYTQIGCRIFHLAFLMYRILLHRSNRHFWFWGQVQVLLLLRFEVGF